MNLADIKDGDTIVHVGNDDCLLRGQLCRVYKENGSDDLYVDCRHGQHWLADDDVCSDFEALKEKTSDDNKDATDGRSEIADSVRSDQSDKPTVPDGS